jgi:hypothetical protein
MAVLLPLGACFLQLKAVCILACMPYGALSAMRCPVACSTSADFADRPMPSSPLMLDPPSDLRALYTGGFRFFLPAAPAVLQQACNHGLQGASSGRPPSEIEVPVRPTPYIAWPPAYHWTYCA